MSLALSTLLYEWRRYMAAVVALAFSGLLVLAQLGMFVGMGKAWTATIDRATADIMILPPGAEGLQGGGASLPRRVMPMVWSHPEVEAVADLDGSWGRIRSIPKPGEDAEKQRQPEQVQITAIDTGPDAVTIPRDYSPELVEALRQPFAIAVDETSLGRLGVQLGDRAIYNGKTVYVRAVLRGYPNMQIANVIMSRDTLRMLGEANNGNRVGPLMVRIKDPARAEIVANQLNRTANGLYKAETRTNLSKFSLIDMVKFQIVGIMLGFSVFLGTLIGVAITWQTLRGAIMANIKEFASLRALGVSMGSLRNIVMELSFWVGIVGVLASFILTWLISLLAAAGNVVMAYPPSVLVLVGVMLILIALMSGFLSLGVLKNSQPADLLR
ncbi:MAG: FtsX-like permease family protein [Brevundimonas sp.]|nr:MAG: FtsX-like permease family protein [Brevundimonas sp.]